MPTGGSADIPLRFIGFVESPGIEGRVVVLTDGEVVFHGRLGDVIDGRYRIVDIGLESVDLERIDGRGGQTLSLPGAAGRAFEAQRELSAALREFRAAAEYDPSNSEVSVHAATLERTIRAQIEAARPPAPIEAMRAQARRETAPPLLNPASRDPLTFEFRETSLQDLIDFIGDATGINVTYDEQFQDRQVTFRIDGMTLEAALAHVLTTNQAFYKVLNPRTIIIVPETPQKRAQYDEQVIQTFYVSHADVQELSQLLSQIVRVPQMAVQPAVVPNTVNNTITVRATSAVTAIIEQVIAANDKPAAEVIIDVEILEVNRERARRFGLNLSDYALGGVFSPEVAPPNEALRHPASARPSRSTSTQFPGA